MPLFAILTHDHPTLHWDFLLEDGDSCRTWRLARPPELETLITATAIPDHRCFYLDYEGPVNRQRGTVSRWDAGSFEWLTRESDRVEIKLAGSRLTAFCTLSMIDPQRWTAVFHGRC